MHSQYSQVRIFDACEELMTGHFSIHKCEGVTVNTLSVKQLGVCSIFPLLRLRLGAHGGVVVHGEHVELHTREIDVTLSHTRIVRSRQISISTPGRNNPEPESNVTGNAGNLQKNNNERNK